MANHKKENVSSYERHKELLTFGIQQKQYVCRWVCSCKAHGEWRSRHHERRAQMFESWKRHLKRKHPDYTLEYNLDGQ